MLHFRFESALNPDDLDPDSMGRLVNFSYRALTDLRSYTKFDRVATEVRTACWKFCEELSRGRVKQDRGQLEDAPEEASMVMLDRFSKASSSIDKLQLGDTVCLFKKNRAVGSLERFFMPGYIRNLSDEVHAEQPAILDGDTRRRARTLSNEVPFPFNCADVPGEIEVDEELTRHSILSAKAYMMALHVQRRQQELEAQAGQGLRRPEDLEEILNDILCPEREPLLPIPRGPRG